MILLFFSPCCIVGLWQFFFSFPFFRNQNKVLNSVYKHIRQSLVYMHIQSMFCDWFLKYLFQHSSTTFVYWDGRSSVSLLTLVELDSLQFHMASDSSEWTIERLWSSETEYIIYFHGVALRFTFICRVLRTMSVSIHSYT